MATLKQMRAIKNRLSLLLVIGTIVTSYFAYTREDIYLLGILGSMLYGAPAAFYLLLVAIRIRWKNILWPWTQFIIIGILPILAYGRLATSMPTDEIAKEHFRVSTYNINYYATKNIDAKIEVLEKIDADILSLLEVNNEWETRLDNYTESYPYRHKLKDTRANATVGLSMLLSKFPIVESTSHADGYAIEHKVDVAGKILNIVQVHPLPPISQALTASRDEVLSHVANLELGEYKIILGDFNAVNWQKPIEKITLSQGVRIATSGMATWPVPLPIAPIDHILTSFNLPHAGHGKICPMQSDHCLIYSDIKLEAAFNTPK